MRDSDENERLSRERLAGFDPATVATMVPVIAGAGAAGNNVGLNLALMGPGEMRIMDFDRVSPSNHARSPGFLIAGAAAGSCKARALARAATRLTPPGTSVVRYASSRMENLGLGAFKGATVVVGAVDSKPGRAYLADATRLLGIPFVEVGFHYPRAHVAIYANRSSNAPCWRCREDRPTAGHFSCEHYARHVVHAGRVPATQPLAAVAGAFAAEACLRLAHGDMTLDDTFISIDLRTMTTETMRLASAEHCAGIHVRIPEPLELQLDHRASVCELFDTVAPTVTSPVLRLRSPFVVSAPCATCGGRVGLGKPEWVLSGVPRCRTCPDTPPTGPGRIHRIGDLYPDDALRGISLRKLGYRSGDVVVIDDEATGVVHAFRLRGGPDALYVSAPSRHASDAPHVTDAAVGDMT